MFLKKEKALVAQGIDYAYGSYHIDVVGECIVEGEKQEIVLITHKRTGKQVISFFLRKRSKSTHTNMVNIAAYAYRLKLHKPVIWLLKKLEDKFYAIELEKTLLELSASLYAFKRYPYHELMMVEDYITENNYLGIIKDELRKDSTYTHVLWYV